MCIRSHTQQRESQRVAVTAHVHSSILLGCLAATVSGSSAFARLGGLCPLSARPHSATRQTTALFSDFWLAALPVGVAWPGHTCRVYHTAPPHQLGPTEIGVAQTVPSGPVHLALLSRAEGGCGLGSHHHITHSRLLSSSGSILRGHHGAVLAIVSPRGSAPRAFCASQTCAVAAAFLFSGDRPVTAFAHPCSQLLSHPLLSRGRGEGCCALWVTHHWGWYAAMAGVLRPSHHQAQLWEGVPLEPHPCLEARPERPRPQPRVVCSSLWVVSLALEGLEQGGPQPLALRSAPDRCSQAFGSPESPSSQWPHPRQHILGWPPRGRMPCPFWAAASETAEERVSALASQPTLMHRRLGVRTPCRPDAFKAVPLCGSQDSAYHQAYRRQLRPSSQHGPRHPPQRSGATTAGGLPRERLGP